MNVLVDYIFNHPMTCGHMDEIAHAFIYQIDHEVSGKRTPSEKWRHEIIPELSVTPRIDGDMGMYFQLVYVTRRDSVTKEKLPPWVFKDDFSLDVSVLVGIRNVAINIMKKVDAINRLDIAIWNVTSVHSFETIFRGRAPTPAQG